MSKDSIKMEQLLATFTSQLKQRYDSPSSFSEKMDKLLRSKREKHGDRGYRVAIEKNLVFLYFFVEELKSILEIMMDRVNDDSEFLKIDPGLTIMEIEKQLRDQTERKHLEIFGDGDGSFLPGIPGNNGGKSYTRKLEFHYSYLMAARSFSVDFINILYAAQQEYRIEKPSFNQAWNYIDMSVNYYIGNIQIGESGSGD